MNLFFSDSKFLQRMDLAYFFSLISHSSSLSFLSSLSSWRRITSKKPNKAFSTLGTFFAHAVSSLHDQILLILFKKQLPTLSTTLYGFLPASLLLVKFSLSICLKFCDLLLCLVYYLYDTLTPKRGTSSILFTVVYPCRKVIV